MIDKVHTTTITAKWKGGFNGRGHLEAPHLATSFGLPKEFLGSGNDTTPEDLFLAAVSSCFLVTFGILLEKAGIKYESLTMNAELLTEIGPPATIREVTLRPKIVTSAEPAIVQKLADRVDDFCVIRKALNVSVQKTVALELQNNKMTDSGPIKHEEFI
jgi:peroxiredoxin-like protein